MEREFDFVEAIHRSIADSDVNFSVLIRDYESTENATAVAAIAAVSALRIVLPREHEIQPV